MTLALHILGWLAAYTLFTGLVMLWVGPRWKRLQDRHDD